MSWTLESQKGHWQKQQQQCSVRLSGSSSQNSLWQLNKKNLITYKCKSKQCLLLCVIFFNFDFFWRAYLLVKHKKITHKSKNKQILNLCVIKLNFSIDFWAYFWLSNTISLHIKVKTNRFSFACAQLWLQFHFLDTFGTVDKIVLIMNRRYLRENNPITVGIISHLASLLAIIHVE